MTHRFYRLGAFIALACSFTMAQAQSYQSRESNHFRESKRVENYAKDVLRNNRNECLVLQNANQRPNGKIVVECLSYNKRNQLRYVISPAREQARNGGKRHYGARVQLVSTKPHNRHGVRDGVQPEWRR